MPVKKGYKQSPEHIQKRFENRINPWSIHPHPRGMLNKHHSEESCKLFSNQRKGKHQSEEWKSKRMLAFRAWLDSPEGHRVKSETRRGTLNPMFGKKLSDQTREKMRLQATRGSKHRWWKGGVTSENDHLRKCSEYKVWRDKVFQRDNYTCQLCGQRCGDLNAHHIKPFSMYPEFRFTPENGRTLCVSCHRKITKYERDVQGKIIGVSDCSLADEE